ncbi:MAG: xanthine dehydrogenase family protein molybdopterin-binding subunit [Deltaproteobacteria bacterium]|nr:xanthine dehydrogenase family protein molybdopterin-binding subunit [Deltaproteobacteria bacterium]
MGDFSIVGTRYGRIDGKDKATGRARYVDDWKFPGMLYGKILRSPYAHARILHIDKRRAEKLIGVRAIATVEDTPQKKYGSYRSGVKDELIFAQDKVRYVGDEVAAVAAIDEETAKDALSLIRVEYEELPGVFHPEEAIKPGAPKVHDGVENNIVAHAITLRGDIEKGFKEADLILENRFETGIQVHAYLEPVGCIVAWDSNGKLTIWAPSQNPSWSRFIYAEALDVPMGKLRVVQTVIGGAFGGKLEQKQYLVAAILAKKAGRPVKIVNTRDEEFQTSMPRVPMVIYLKMGIKKDGMLTAKEHRIYADNGAYTKYATAVLNLGTYRVDGLYRLRNIRNENYLIYTNKVPTSAFRGFGNPQITFAVESLLDTLAEGIGMDALEVRLRNAAEAGDLTAHGFKYVSCGLKECLHKTAEAIGWKTKRGQKNIRRGVGISATSHVCGNRSFFPLFDGATAYVRVDEGGKVKILTGEVEVGQGLLTAYAAICAEEMGIPLSEVSVEAPDTDIAPFGLGTWGDRGTFIGGGAVKLAATDAQKQILEVGAEMLEANVSDLDCQGGKVFVKGSPHKFIPFEEVASAAVYRRGGSPVLGKGTFIPASELADETRYGNISGTYAFGAQTAEVEVNEETGEVRVLQIAAAHDVGQAINITTAEGQVEGATIQGMGYALSEEVQYERGVMLTPNFLSYRIPTSLDVPPMKTFLVKTIDPGPFGAKGVAEPAMTPTAPAIANAIYDAIGVRIRTLPITPQKILEALKKKKSTK